MLGIKPRILCLLGKCSNTELQMVFQQGSYSSLLCIYAFKKYFSLGQVWWCMAVIPAKQEVGLTLEKKQEII